MIAFNTVCPAQSLHYCNLYSLKKAKWILKAKYVLSKTLACLKWLAKRFG